MATAKAITFATGECNSPQNIESELPPNDLLVSIHKHLTDLGCTTTTICQHSFYGWDMTALVHGRCFSILLQRPNGWHLSIQQKGVFNFIRAKRSKVECESWLAGQIVEWLRTGTDARDIALIDEWAPPTY